MRVYGSGNSLALGFQSSETTIPKALGPEPVIHKKKDKPSVGEELSMSNGRHNGHAGSGVSFKRFPLRDWGLRLHSPQPDYPVR